MPIAQINFNYPSRWELDAPQLAAGGTHGGEKKTYAAKIREESLKVAAWIAVCLKNLQHFRNNMDTMPLQVSSIVYLTIVQYILFRCKDTYVFI